MLSTECSAFLNTPNDFRVFRKALYRNWIVTASVVNESTTVPEGGANGGSPSPALSVLVLLAEPASDPSGPILHFTSEAGPLLLLETSRVVLSLSMLAARQSGEETATSSMHRGRSQSAQ
ncbi:hypothetical protein GW7_03794 [Heterocephalus glaber]|uniref:Uncharacterized protein n=1 Tax=Heterocephalus glaber TaxID=10181 RepID=G5B712_HETGA|nr:hypothetical protein GW7_03794 [Heterocephalus glaber]